MDHRTLSIFLTVADTLNFSRSAEALHLSVSAVSRSISRLEDELGQPLFERDKRRVRLTAAGGEFQRYARESVAQWQQVLRRLGNDGELAGEISLYCSVTASYSVLAPILERFRVTHPAVEIMLHTGDQTDGYSRVLEGQDDFAVIGRPEQLPGRMDFLPLRQSPLRFWMPRADCSVRDAVLGVEPASASMDWDATPLIVPERGVTKEALDRFFVERGIRPRMYAQVAGHEAIVAMVALGLGVGVAPALVVEAGAMSERVEPLTTQDLLPPLVIGLAALRQRLANPLVKSLWDVAAQTYASDF